MKNMKSKMSETAKPRGQATKKKILAAAKIVFATHPYNAASIRMIAAQGAFEHGIIRYHFPNKASLFEAVTIDICDRIFQSNSDWLKEAGPLSPGEGLSLYLDRLCFFNAREPENLKVIALNLAQNDYPEAVPGYDHIIEMLAAARRTFEQTLPVSAPRDMIQRFQDSFNALVLHYLGASSCQARILGLDPHGDEYRIWVKDTMLAVFLPLLESMISSGRR